MILVMILIIMLVMMGIIMVLEKGENELWKF